MGSGVNGPVMVYSTVENMAEARAIARALIERRLAACVNILPGARSVYRWEGKIEETQECALLIKTDRTRLDDLLKAARSLHPYDVPALLVLPVEGGDKAYLDWAAGEVVGGAEG